MNHFFVTGTDTDVGKTLVSAILVKLLNGVYWKPIQSGTDEGMSDSAFVKQLTGLPEEHFIPSSYEFKAPLSPDQAAKKENKVIDHRMIQLPKMNKPLVVEGAGGLKVPLNETTCVIDLIKQLNLPVILVARGTLGTINHSLLSIAALKEANILIHGIVFSGRLNVESQKTIEKWGEVKTLFHVPYFENINFHSVAAWVNEYRLTFLKEFA